MKLHKGFQGYVDAFGKKQRLTKFFCPLSFCPLLVRFLLTQQAKPESRLSLGTALVHRGFITKDTRVCRLICAAIGAPTRLRIK